MDKYQAVRLPVTGFAKLLTFENLLNMVDNQSNTCSNVGTGPMIVQVVLPVKKYFAGKNHQWLFEQGSPT